MFSQTELLYLIQDHGKQLTWTSKGTSSYNVLTSQPTTSDTSVTVLGYFYNYQLGDVDGVSIVLGDRRLALPTTDTSGNTIPTPKKGDTFAGESDTVSVVRVDKIMSGDNAVGFVCQVRE